MTPTFGSMAMTANSCTSRAEAPAALMSSTRLPLTGNRSGLLARAKMQRTGGKGDGGICKFPTPGCANTLKLSLNTLKDSSKNRGTYDN